MQDLRRAFVIEANCFNENFEIERYKLFLPHPIAGAFKVTDGKITCKITINESGVELLLKDENGNIERLRSQKIRKQHSI